MSKTIIVKKEAYQPEKVLNNQINYRRYRKVNGKINRGRQPQTQYMIHLMENMFNEGNYVIPENKQIQMEQIAKQYQKKLNGKLFRKFNIAFETVMSQYKDKLKDYKWERKSMKNSNEFAKFMQECNDPNVLISQKKPQFAQAITAFRNGSNISWASNTVKQYLENTDKSLYEAFIFKDGRYIYYSLALDKMRKILKIAQEKFGLTDTELNKVKVTFNRDECSIFQYKAIYVKKDIELVEFISQKEIDNIEKSNTNTTAAVVKNKPLKSSVNHSIEDLIKMLKDKGAKEIVLKF